MFRGLEQSRKVGNHESRKMNKKTERHIKSHFGSKIDAKMLLDQQTKFYCLLPIYQSGLSHDCGVYALNPGTYKCSIVLNGRTLKPMQLPMTFCMAACLCLSVRMKHQYSKKVNTLGITMVMTEPYEYSSFTISSSLKSLNVLHKCD